MCVSADDEQNQVRGTVEYSGYVPITMFQGIANQTLNSLEIITEINGGINTTGVTIVFESLARAPIDFTVYIFGIVDPSPQGGTTILDDDFNTAYIYTSTTEKEITESDDGVPTEFVDNYSSYNQ